MIASGVNSYAKVYAENNGYQWKEPVKEPILELLFDEDTLESIDIRLLVNRVSTYTFGDVTMEQKVDFGDAFVVLKMAANLLERNATEESATDVNGDGKVDSSDALLILKYVAQLIEDF